MGTMPPGPIAGQDYPQTWTQFMDWFATDELCQRYLERLRWPHGFVCTKCGKSAPPYRANRMRLMCRVCKFQSSDHRRNHL